MPTMVYYEKLAAYARQHGNHADATLDGVRVQSYWVNAFTGERGDIVETVRTLGELRNVLGY